MSLFIDFLSKKIVNESVVTECYNQKNVIRLLCIKLFTKKEIQRQKRLSQEFFIVSIEQNWQRIYQHFFGCSDIYRIKEIKIGIIIQRKQKSRNQSYYFGL